MSAGGAVMFSSPTVAERMFAGRPASVWRSRTLPILIFLQLFHSSIQLGSCRPLSLRSLAESPASLFPRPTGLQRVLRQQRKVYLGPRRGRIGFAHRHFYCASPFFWSAGEFSVRTRFLDRRLPTAFSLIQCEQISQTFFLFSPFFAILNTAVSSFCHLSINYRTLCRPYSLNEGMKVTYLGIVSWLVKSQHWFDWLTDL